MRARLSWRPCSTACIGSGAESLLYHLHLCRAGTQRQRLACMQGSRLTDICCGELL